jgi:hypothetical protein
MAERGINGLIPGAKVDKSAHLAPLDMTFLLIFCGQCRLYYEAKRYAFFFTFLLFPLSWAQLLLSALQTSLVSVPGVRNVLRPHQATCDTVFCVLKF